MTIETVAGVGAVGAVHAEAVFQILKIQSEDDHRPDVADAKSVGIGDLHERPRLPLAKQHQRAADGVAREDGEVDPAGDDGRAEGLRPPGAQP